jgi:hypothetical protein
MERQVILDSEISCIDRSEWIHYFSLIRRLSLSIDTICQHEIREAELQKIAEEKCAEMCIGHSMEFLRVFLLPLFVYIKLFFFITPVLEEIMN